MKKKGGKRVGAGRPKKRGLKRSNCVSVYLNDKELQEVKKHYPGAGLSIRIRTLLLNDLKKAEVCE